MLQFALIFDELDQLSPIEKNTEYSEAVKWLIFENWMKEFLCFIIDVMYKSNDKVQNSYSPDT